MNIYLIERPGGADWADYEGAVVQAESEEAARRIHPSDRFEWPPPEVDSKEWLDGWVPAKDVFVTLLGEAREGLAEECSPAILTSQ